MLPPPGLRPELQAQLNALAQALGTEASVVADQQGTIPGSSLQHGRADATQPQRMEATGCGVLHNDPSFGGVAIGGAVGSRAIVTGCGAPAGPAAGGVCSQSLQLAEDDGGLSTGAGASQVTEAMWPNMLSSAKPSVEMPVAFNSKGFPVRPGVQSCDFYLKFRDCKYGKNCCWDHPEELPEIKYLGKNSKGLPLRPGAMRCSTYLRTGACAYGEECRCDHPESEALSTNLGVERKILAAAQAAKEIAKTLGTPGEVPDQVLTTAPECVHTVAAAHNLEPTSTLENANAARETITAPDPPQAAVGDDRGETKPVRERKRRRGWDSDSAKQQQANAASLSAKCVQEMVKNWVPSEKQLDGMSTEELQAVLNQWKCQTKFTTRDALLAKAKKVIIG